MLNITFGAYNPYTQPLEYCGVVEGAVQAHYQGLLSTYWGVFLLGGVVIGFCLSYALFLYLHHTKN